MVIIEFSFKTLLFWVQYYFVCLFIKFPKFRRSEQRNVMSLYVFIKGVSSTGIGH